MNRAIDRVGWFWLHCRHQRDAPGEYGRSGLHWDILRKIEIEARLALS